MKLGKYSGLFLIVTGILHVITAIILFWSKYWDMIKAGLVNSVEKDSSRELALWFLVCGVIIILFGQTLHYYQKREHRPAPLALGYNMLIFAIVGCLMCTVSGFWLFLPQAIIIILANKRR